MNCAPQDTSALIHFLSRNVIQMVRIVLKVLPWRPGALLDIFALIHHQSKNAKMVRSVKKAPLLRLSAPQAFFVQQQNQRSFVYKDFSAKKDQLLL